MTACTVADSAGVALRVAAYLDCQGRALGEGGFAAVAGGIVAGSLLTGLVTIFIALIGYRLVLGEVPGLRDGVTWMVRLGMVLTLATSWPAFQTLVYNVAVEGPDELASALLPAAGLAAGDLAGSVQGAYDALRLGSEPAAPPPPRAATDAAASASAQSSANAAASTVTSTPRPQTVQPPLPQTASLLVVFTVGIIGALRVAIGLLLALGPLAVAGLLFDQTLGLVSGWLRSLAGAAFALVAATIVVALEVAVLNGELARSATSGGLDPASFDAQALPTVVLLFALVMLIATIAASRVVGALWLHARRSLPRSTMGDWALGAHQRPSARYNAVLTRARPASAEPISRAILIAQAAASATRRQAGDAAITGDWGATARPGTVSALAQRSIPAPTPLGLRGRRSQSRPSRAAVLRDRER